MAKPPHQRSYDPSYLSGSGTDFYPITPADTPQPRWYRAIFVGTGGTVVLRNSEGTSVPFNVPDGGQLDIEILYVMAATTASDIVGIV